MGNPNTGSQTIASPPPRPSKGDIFVRDRVIFSAHFEPCISIPGTILISPITDAPVGDHSPTDRATIYCQLSPAWSTLLRKSSGPSPHIKPVDFHVSSANQEVATGQPFAERLCSALPVRRGARASLSTRKPSRRPEFGKAGAPCLPGGTDSAYRNRLAIANTKRSGFPGSRRAVRCADALSASCAGLRIATPRVCLSSSACAIL